MIKNPHQSSSGNQSHLLHTVDTTGLLSFGLLPYFHLALGCKMASHLFHTCTSPGSLMDQYPQIYLLHLHNLDGKKNPTPQHKLRCLPIASLHMQGVYIQTLDPHEMPSMK